MHPAVERFACLAAAHAPHPHRGLPNSWLLLPRLHARCVQQGDQRRSTSIQGAAQNGANGRQVKAQRIPPAAAPPFSSSRLSGVADSDPEGFADLPGFAPDPAAPTQRPLPNAAPSTKQARFGAVPQGPSSGKLHTVDCKFWLNGGCPRGNGCWFRHDPVRRGRHTRVDAYT